jgi:hypothetical protein
VILSCGRGKIPGNGTNPIGDLSQRIDFYVGLFLSLTFIAKGRGCVNPGKVQGVRRYRKKIPIFIMSIRSWLHGRPDEFVEIYSINIFKTMSSSLS